MEERMDIMKERILELWRMKVILISLAEIAVRTNAKAVYKAIAKMANVEGVILSS